MNRSVSVGIIVFLGGLLLLLVALQKADISGAFFKNQLLIGNEHIAGPCTARGAHDLAEEVIYRHYGCKYAYCGYAARDRWFPGQVQLAFDCPDPQQQLSFQRSCSFALQSLCDS